MSDPETFKKKIIPDRVKDIAEIVGAPIGAIAVELEFSSFDAPALNFVDNVGMHRTCMALRGLCTDEIAKQAVQRAIKLIKYTNIKSGEPKVVLENDKHVLHYFGNYAAGLSGAVSDRDTEIYLGELFRLKFQRQMKKLKEVQLPGRQKDADEIVQGHIPLEPDFDSFTTAESVEFFDDSALHRTLMALRGVINNSDTTRAVVRDQLKRVTYKNITDVAQTKLSFENGVLHMSMFYDRSKAPPGDNFISNLTIEALMRSKFSVESVLKLKELKEKLLPERTKELEEILGQKVVYQVEFETFDNFESLNFLDNVLCHRLNMALRCAPANVRTLLKPLKTVHVKCVKSADKKVELKGDTLQIWAEWGKGLDGAFSDNDILAVLKKLAQ